MDDISNLNDNVNPVTPVKKYQYDFVCEHCDFSFESKQFLKDHVSNFHMPVKCMKCKKTFVNNKWFENHTCKNEFEKKMSTKKSAQNNSMNDVEYSISDEPSTLSSPIPVSTVS